MSPQQEARDWARGHVDALVTLEDEVWRIEATTSEGAHVLLRRADDDRARVAPAEAVRRAYLADNS